ncbi:MAG: acetyltransferase [Bdellovibrionaceae bacterium]|nr:acetyltransferase [Pseudobdellovibrionaceae bacterium]
MEDFVLLKRWQSLPHVMMVWGNERYEEPYEQYVFRTADGSVKQFIIEIDGNPIGYFQYYWASRVGEGWWEGFDPATVGIDFYIGEPDCLGKGIGSKVIASAKRMLFKDPMILRIIADPSPSNGKIIHLLRKAGFESQGEIETPDGKALLMELLR